MSVENPKKTTQTPEEIAQIQEGRVFNDANLIANGAKYKVGENGDIKTLELTKEQIERAEKEKDIDLEVKNFSEDEQRYFEGYKKTQDMAVEILYMKNKGTISDEIFRELMGKVESLNGKGREQFEVNIGVDACRKAEKVWREQLRLKKADLFNDVETFDELLNAINKVDSISDQAQCYTLETLKKNVNGVRDGSLNEDSLTSVFGFKDAVLRVLYLEKKKKSEENDEEKVAQIRQELDSKSSDKQIKEQDEKILNENESEKYSIKIYDKYLENVVQIEKQFADLIKKQGLSLENIDLWEEIRTTQAL